MKNKPIVRTFEDGSKIWSHSFEHFRVKVYIPVSDLPDYIINYGFEAPYLVILEEQELDEDGAKAWADEKGLAQIASRYATSVVFVFPNCEGGWDAATDDLYIELIGKTKIHEYHEDGYAILNNRFTKQCEGYAIRGAIFRTFLFGQGKSADYVATNLLKNIDGPGLWGPADVAPTACILEHLSAQPIVGRADMPLVSIGNSSDINEFIMEQVEDCYLAPEADYLEIFQEFLRHYKRWGWVGTLMDSPDFEELGVVEEPGIVTVRTSADNAGDDRETDFHEIGYLAYYNKDLFVEGSVPLMLCFHGGGDSAMHIAKVSEWYRVAMDHNFLLICVENHLNSTATEMMELLDHLQTKYDIDKTRIYATGFSMGGCKTWDLYQEYPEVFAGLAPMSATFDVGLNLYGNKVEKEINQNVLVPIFYAGGEVTPLPELPFQEQKCLNRMAYVFAVNQVVKAYDVKLEQKASWENPIWGVSGDRTEEIYDASRDATLTIQYYDSTDGKCYSAFGCISGQGHECRYHTCEMAWKFVSQFRRVDHTIEMQEG